MSKTQIRFVVHHGYRFDGGVHTYIGSGTLAWLYGLGQHNRSIWEPCTCMSRFPTHRMKKVPGAVDLMIQPNGEYYNALERHLSSDG